KIKMENVCVAISVILLQFLTLCRCLETELQCSKDSPCDGGWFTNEADLIAHPGPCNVDTVDYSLSQTDFMSIYATEKPFVIRGATHNEHFRTVSTKDIMLKEYGQRKVILSSANTHSYTKVEVPLEKYINEIMKPQKIEQLGNETLYWFGDNNYTEWQEFFDQYIQPKYKLPDMTGALSFGIAGAGTGVPFHFHGPGFGEVIYGRKRWFLYPPDQKPEFHPNRTTLHWLMEDYPKLIEYTKPLECTLNVGDIIYFPDRWWHGTLNIDTSVFMSTFLG
ncbi:unnamed protein product, partial [Owenia fusiformis]